MFKFHELDKEICLTCQYYDTPRRVEVIGNKVFIDFDKTTGNCKLFNSIMRINTCKAGSTSFCHYKRWVELP